jgi:hypothetical protein
MLLEQGCILSPFYISINNLNNLNGSAILDISEIHFVLSRTFSGLLMLILSLLLFLLSPDYRYIGLALALGILLVFCIMAMNIASQWKLALTILLLILIPLESVLGKLIITIILALLFLCIAISYRCHANRLIFWSTW